MSVALNADEERLFPSCSFAGNHFWRGTLTALFREPESRASSTMQIIQLASLAILWILYTFIYIKKNGSQEKALPIA